MVRTFAPLREIFSVFVAFVTFVYCGCLRYLLSKSVAVATGRGGAHGRTSTSEP